MESISVGEFLLKKVVPGGTGVLKTGVQRVEKRKPGAGKSSRYELGDGKKKKRGV